VLNAKRIFMPLVVFVVAAGSAAPAATIDFSGSGTSGTINPNSLAWVLTPDDSAVPFLSSPRDISVWGSPGLGENYNTWPTGDGQAVSFSITFTGLPDGVTIDQTADTMPTGFDDFSRFHNDTDTIIWTPSYSGGDSVTFTAPSGYSMPAGTEFYVNIAFAGGTVDTVDFTGDWTTAAVPEPGSLLLAAVAFLGMAALARRRVLR
jgi:hypothetical protein